MEAGEIPWMTKQSSTWEQIFAHETEMSTISLVVKGEKVDSLVSIDIDIKFLTYLEVFYGISNLNLTPLPSTSKKQLKAAAGYNM